MNKKSFLDAINTLKLYQRAELLDERGKRLVKDLYVDPLPDEHVLNTVLRPTSTFLIGRKGTGKSTIFQRAQDVLDADPQKTWAYIDIKTLFESSTSELVGIPENDPAIGSLSPVSIKRIYVFRSFVLELVKEIKKQIEARVTATVWGRFREAFNGSLIDLFEELDEFVADLHDDRFLNVTGTLASNTATEHKKTETTRIGADSSLNIGAAPTVNIQLLAEMVAALESRRSDNYSEVFVRVFNVRQLIFKLREILRKLGVKNLYIFLDDFSELPQQDMKEVVDTVLSPFNNWSDGFIKVKVAIYPGRLYFGAIDPSKIDEVYLDVYRAYGRSDVSGMEERAIDFTQRLITKRFDFFCAEEIEQYFEIEAEGFWRTIFYSCLGNPRILGYILYFCYETNIIYGRRIGPRTIQDASRRYFEEKIAGYFRINKFLHETFEERSSIFSLKELFEEVVRRAKKLRTYKESKVMREISGRPPTSHFHVIREYDSVLSTLELNFFLTKYYEMKDRDGREVSVYALNYGLCQQQSISFGRPHEKREHRLYFVERIFDYSPIIDGYIKVNQEILCDMCGQRHGHEMLPAIQAFGMLCPKCREGSCRIINLSRKYEDLIRSVSADDLLPGTELGILKTLHDDRREMFAKEIAAELDCSWQLIGRRAKNLAERSMVLRASNEKGRRVFTLTSAAEATYFNSEDGDDLDLGE